MRCVCGWVIVLAGCVAPPKADGVVDTEGTSEDGPPHVLDASDDTIGATGQQPPINEPVTTGAEEGSTSAVPPDATTSAAADSGESEGGSTAGGTGRGESEGGEGSSGGTFEPPVDPIVLVVGSTGFSGPETPGLTGLDGFIVEWDETVCESIDCAGNGPPAIGEAILRVNGAFVPSSTTVHVGDSVGVLWPFEDPGCNLSCGETGHWIIEPLGESAGGGSWATNIPCGTTESNVYLAAELYEVDDPGSYNAQVSLTDACGSQSGWASLPFDVVP